jgi:hypothetical protein
MNKKFSRIIISFALAFAMFIPMFATKATAQGTRTSSDIVFVARVNSQFSVLESILIQAQTQFGIQRVFLISGTLLGISETQLELEAQGFGLNPINFIMASILAQQVAIPVNRIVVFLNSGRTFGDIALALSVQMKPITVRINAFMDVFASELGIQAGTNTPTDEELIALLTRILELLNTRLDTLQVRLGVTTFNTIVLSRLSIETNIPIDELQLLRNRFTNLSISNFAMRLLLASTLSATSIQELADLGFVFEDVTITTPLGAFRALGAFGVPVSVFVARVDVFQRLVRADANSTPPASGGGM